MRRRISITDPASPPPSPIPTGKGSRSASNEPFARFLDRSAGRVPALSLPGTHPTQNVGHFPAKVDLREMLTATGGSIGRALESARDFGVVRVVGHGLSVAELGSAVEESEWERVVVGGLAETKCLLTGSRSHESSFELAWRGAGDWSSDRKPSESMTKFAYKLEEIGEQITRILLGNASEKLSENRIFEGAKSVLSLYRFNHKNSMEKNQLPLSDKLENDLCDQIYLGLHIPFENCQIYVQSEEDQFSFDASSETLVVTVGKKIEELSHKEFKSVYGRMIFLPAPEVRRSQANSFSIQLKYSYLSSSSVFENNRQKIISIGDQIMIAIAITFVLYKFFMFLIF